MSHHDSHPNTIINRPKPSFQPISLSLVGFPTVSICFQFSSWLVFVFIPFSVCILTISYRAFSSSIVSAVSVISVQLTCLLDIPMSWSGTDGVEFSPSGFILHCKLYFQFLERFLSLARKRESGLCYLGSPEKQVNGQKMDILCHESLQHMAHFHHVAAQTLIMIIFFFLFLVLSPPLFCQ